MRHILYSSDISKLQTAILIKDSSFLQNEITTHYVNPLVAEGINQDTLISYTLNYFNLKKTTAAQRKEYLNGTLLPELNRIGITTLYVADSEYFKTLTGNVKADVHMGYTLLCTLKGYEHLNVILGVNYQALVYNPLVKSKLTLSLTTLIKHVKGNYNEPGKGIIKEAYYPKYIADIYYMLQDLHKYPELTCDIETFSLKFYEAGIGTISFSPDKHSGVAFACDYQELPEPSRINNITVKKLIKQFLTEYKGKLTYHNGNFDMKVLVYELWMRNLGDYRGMLQGIDILTRAFDDTKIIAYLATNNAVKNELGLKVLAQAFAGNYAQEDIKDIRLIPLAQLLEYNLVDCLSTWYVKEKYLPKMIEEQQEEIYREMFKPSVKLLLQIELVGMPIDPKKVREAHIILEEIVAKHTVYLQGSSLIKDFHYTQLQARVVADNLKLKKKVRTIEELAHIKFNPGSDKQLQDLIYEYLGYEIIDKTDSGAPATGGKTLAKLINHARTDEHRDIFNHLIGLSKANKVLTSFIPAFEKAQRLPDGSYRLYGNFNLGGTQSGRLSSSDPNLQNIPSGSTYALIVKRCFVSIKGWIFGGADFTALEAMGGALLSRDPNLLKVYIDGYDSHCVNTFAYFHEQMPDIVDTVQSINSIKKKYKKLRSKSKAPTFALQYKGTWRTVMKSAGVPALDAQAIEQNYKELYKVSIAWIDGVLDMAHKTGFVEGAFGLKIRTPILARTPVNLKKMPYMADAERRSAGNAKTQSYGLLNNRAAIAFQKLIDASPYRYDIFMCALIHDAIYAFWRDDIKITKWVNENLIACMRWQELPELQHDVVKLGAALDMYWPSWADALEIPNDASEEEIKRRAKNHHRKLYVPKPKYCMRRVCLN
jgi:DNA polymerase-1